jgi:hypothetical protein
MKISASVIVLSDRASHSAIWLFRFRALAIFTMMTATTPHSSLCGCCYRACNAVAGNDLGSAFQFCRGMCTAISAAFGFPRTSLRFVVGNRVASPARRCRRHLHRFVTLLKLMPISIGDALNTCSFAMAYNCYGWSALGVICLAVFLPPSSQAGSAVDAIVFDLRHMVMDCPPRVHASRCCLRTPNRMVCRLRPKSPFSCMHSLPERQKPLTLAPLLLAFLNFPVCEVDASVPTGWILVQSEPHRCASFGAWAQLEGLVTDRLTAIRTFAGRAPVVV